MALNTVGIFLNKTLFLPPRRLSHRRRQTSQETTVCIDNIRPGHQYPIKYLSQYCKMIYFDMPAISVSKKCHRNLWFSSVQLLSHVQLFETPWTTVHQASLSITNSRSSLRLTSIESVMPSNHLILSYPLLLLPSSFPASGSFQMSPLSASRGQSIGVSASTSVLTMNTQEISLRMGWLDVLAVQGTLKSFLQPHSSKPSILWCSAFFIVQLSHPYMTTGKTIALTRRTFVD